MTDKTDKPADDETEWKQLTQAEINAIVKEAQAREAKEEAEREEGEESEGKDAKAKRGRPAKLRGGE